LTDQEARGCRDASGEGASGGVECAALDGGLPVRSPYGFEWKTRAAFFGIPLICIAYGRDHRGKFRVAKGFLAIGQCALGGIVIAQFGAGVLAIGQFVTGLFAVGQFALGGLLAAGQFSGGLLAVGQVVVGIYGLGQVGWATYLWSQGRTDMEAVSMFYTIKMMVLHQGGITFGEVLRGGYDWGTQTLRSLFK